MKKHKIAKCLDRRIKRALREADRRVNEQQHIAVARELCTVRRILLEKRTHVRT